MFSAQKMVYMYRILPKISPLPSLTLKFLHRYVRLDYKPPPPSRLHTYTRARVRTYVRNPALQLTTSTKRNLLYMVVAFRKACFEVILL